MTYQSVSYLDGATFNTLGAGDCFYCHAAYIYRL